MNEPDETSSRNPASPPADAKRAPASTPVVENRAVETGKTAASQTAAAKPAIDSTLVGKAESASPAAAKKPVEKVAEKPAPEKPVGEKPVTETPKPAGSAAPAAKPVPVTQHVPTAAATAATAPRRGGFFPTFLGGVVAAGLGAAACYWAIPHLPAGWQPPAPAAAASDAQLDAARQAGTEAAKAEFQAQADALGTRAAEAGADAARQILADAAPAATPGNPSTAGLAATSLPPDLADKIAALEKTVADLGTRPADPQVAAASQQALDALNARLAEQQARLDELAARPAVDPATASQVQTLAQQAEQLQQATEAANRRAQAATASSALLAAIENGAPRDQALAALQASGVEVPAVLTGDVPRLAELRAEFPAAARAALKAARDSGAGSEGAMGALGNFLRLQTGARSVEPREGSDPDAVLSRANAAVDSGDIAGALAEIGALPQAGQDAMAAWIARAKTWTEANAALAALVAGGQ